MATAFDNLMAACARAPLRDAFGESATYIAPDGTETAATVSFSAERSELVYEDHGAVLRRQLEAILWKDEVADVDKTGSISRAGTIWPIDEVVQETAVRTVVRLIRNEPQEVSRENFRRR